MTIQPNFEVTQQTIQPIIRQEVTFQTFERVAFPEFPEGTFLANLWNRPLYRTFAPLNLVGPFI